MHPVRPRILFPSANTNRRRGRITKKEIRKRISVRCAGTRRRPPVRKTKAPSGAVRIRRVEVQMKPGAAELHLVPAQVEQDVLVEVETFVGPVHKARRIAHRTQYTGEAHLWIPAIAWIRID